MSWGQCIVYASFILICVSLSMIHKGKSWKTWTTILCIFQLLFLIGNLMCIKQMSGFIIPALLLWGVGFMYTVFFAVAAFRKNGSNTNNVWIVSNKGYYFLYIVSLLLTFCFFIPLSEQNKDQQYIRELQRKHQQAQKKLINQHQPPAPLL